MGHAARTRHVLVGGLVAVLLGAVVTVALVVCGTDGCATRSGVGTGEARLADPSVSFRIAGDTRRPLAPGVRAPVNVELTNPHGFRILVTDLRVSVRRVQAPRANASHPCSRRDFEVDQLGTRRAFLIGPTATRTLRGLNVVRARWPHVGMVDRPVNQDGCKAARLTLRYTADGTNIRR